MRVADIVARRPPSLVPWRAAPVRQWAENPSLANVCSDSAPCRLPTLAPSAKGARREVMLEYFSTSENPYNFSRLGLQFKIRARRLPQNLRRLRDLRKASQPPSRRGRRDENSVSADRVRPRGGQRKNRSAATTAGPAEAGAAKAGATRAGAPEGEDTRPRRSLDVNRPSRWPSVMVRPGPQCPCAR